MPSRSPSRDGWEEAVEARRKFFHRFVSIGDPGRGLRTPEPFTEEATEEFQALEKGEREAEDSINRLMFPHLFK